MSNNRLILSIYWQHARKYKKQLWTIYPLMVVAQLMEDFLAPLLVSGVLNKIASNNLDELQNNRVWLIFLGIIALEAGAHLIWNRLIRIFWATQDKIMVDLSLTTFKHLEKMSLKFFSDRFAGSLVNQANKFVGSFERLTDPLTWNVFKLLVSLLLTFIILVPQIPIVAFAIITIAIIYTPLIWYVRKKQIPYTAKWAAAETRRTGQLADTVSNIVAVKSFANEEIELGYMEDKVHDVHDRSIDTMRISLNQELGTGAVQRSINIAVIILSVLLAVNGVIEVGVIYLALTFTIAIMRRLWDLNNTFRSFARVFGDALDMALILQIEPEIKDPIKPVDFKPTKGSIEFVGVDFQYGDDKNSKPLFSDLNIQINSGEKIGLVGPSGGGKSTITKLLLRFMDVESGEIKIDSIPISKVSQCDLRKYISYVPQEPLLFHRTISENIAYGDTKATKKEIIDAAKKAHAHEFIVELTDGYKTLVGERGVKLSGGQKQRIAIARSMIKKAPILVLDEATSALDSESEQLIQDALWKLMEGKTAIIIAHRLSTIQKMDRILVLENGKIIEDGSHNDLLKKKNGHYARLWKHQSGGFLQD